MTDTYPPSTLRDVITGSTGAIGLGPYGDEAEHNGPPEVILQPDFFRPFFATDARSVLVTVLPNHYNFIPNPSFRTDMSGWETASTGNLLTDNQASGTDTLGTTEGWGSSYQCTYVSSTSFPIQGTRSLVLTATGASPTVYGYPLLTCVPVVAGQTYTALAEFQTQAGSTVAPSLSIRFYDGAGTNLGQTIVGGVAGSGNQTLAVTAVAPATAEYATPVVGGSLATVGDTVKVDRVSVHAGAGGNWEMPATFTLSPDSWVGQSVQCTGTGNLRYRAGTDRFVYVGNPDGLSIEQMDYRRSGAEWTFSTYAKGSGKVRLRMDAYFAEESETQPGPPEYQNLPVIADPVTEPAGFNAILGPEGHVWLPIDPEPSVSPFYEDSGSPPAFENVEGEWHSIEDDGEWHRVVIRTRARVPEGNNQISFLGAQWIDTLIEVEDAGDLFISSVMLDSAEYPDAAFFDGGITEESSLDDFLWEGEANNSASLYYFDRLVRTKWLCTRLPQVVPAGRPYQIFFGSYWRPFVCETGETVMMTLPG